MSLELSPERRAELVELIDDADRLRSTYPKVADYLATAPMLPGTDDPDGDAAFELRMVHYLTLESATPADNPLWSVVGPSVSSVDGRRVVNGGSANGSARLGYAQMTLQALYAYAVPAPETLRWVAEFVDGRRLVELGAGRGYWARQLHDTGVEVAAHDSEPPDAGGNVSFPRAAGHRDTWFPVRGMDSVELRSDDVLMLCWPPGWGDPMASTALRAFEQVGGDRLIYIGEPAGGKTGDAPFHEALATRWELVTEDPQFVSWWNLSDRAGGYRRVV